MKYILIVCFCLISVSHQINDQEANPEFYQKVVDSAEECVKLSNVKGEDLEHMFDDKFDANGDVKCYVKCILEKTGVMNSDGEIQEDILRDSLPLTYDDSKKDDMIEKCGKQSSDDACETAYNLAKCCESYQ